MTAGLPFGLLTSTGLTSLAGLWWSLFLCLCLCFSFLTTGLPLERERGGGRGKEGGREGRGWR